MNFNKINDLRLELDKNESEIMLENKINDLFNFVVLEAEILIEYYNQILEFYYRKVKNRKEIFDVFLNLKRQIEFEYKINI